MNSCIRLLDANRNSMVREGSIPNAYRHRDMAGVLNENSTELD